MMRLLFIAIFFPFLLNAQSIGQKVDELLTAYAGQKKFSGNVLVASNGEVIFEKSYGFADIAGNKPNTRETEFRVGSLTKMFTSAVILQLADEGIISLDDRVSKHVPGFTDGDKIQIRHLLSHTSGIAGHTPAPEPSDLEDQVKKFKSNSLAFEPGTRFEYNNFNYILLSYIAQKTSGMRFEELMARRILKKAGMDHSGLDSMRRVSQNRAKGYVTNPSTAEWQEAGGGNVALASGAGALYSTARDLYKWSLSVSGNEILPQHTMTTALTPVQNNYGFGWMTTEVFGRKQVGHTGSIPGFIANFMNFPDQKMTIILLSNYQDVDGRKLSKDLAAAAFGEPYELPVKKTEVHVASEILARYAGEYKLPNGFSITVSSEEGKLYALAMGDAHKIELTPESNNKFYLKGPETAIEFLEENGEVKYMFVNIQGGQKLERVR